MWPSVRVGASIAPGAPVVTSKIPRMWRLIVVVAVAAMSVALSLSAQDDVVSALRTTDAEARGSIFSSFATGVIARTGDASVFKAATPQQRVSITRAVIALARAFSGTAEFVNRYAAYRNARRPGPEAVARTGDEARLEQQKAIEMAIKQAMAGAERMPADERKQLEQNIAEMRRQVAEIASDPDFRLQLDDTVAAAAKRADAEFLKKTAAFDAELPADPKMLIATRLRQFIALCSTVDFAATLQVGEDKKLRFVNPAYEQKPSEWKMCFRAGKPAVDAARAAAEEWLKALPQ